MIIKGKVIIGKNAMIANNVQLGNDENGTLIIGDDAVIRSGTVIYSDVVIGNFFQSGHNVLIRENSCIGDNVLAGTNVVIENDAYVGSCTKLQTGAYVTSHTVIEDRVFMGPYSVTTNDKYMDSTSVLRGPHLNSGARIGARAIILPGVEVGKNAVVGSGSVVTRSVPEGVTVFGNPARMMRG